MDNFFRINTFLDFSLLQEVNWAYSWTKNANFEYVLRSQKFDFLEIPHVEVRHLSGITCGQYVSSIKRLLLELLSKNTQNWAQLGHEAKKNRGIRKVTSRTSNTQKLKLMDLETMDRWSYYSLCENLC